MIQAFTDKKEAAKQIFTSIIKPQMKIKFQLKQKITSNKIKATNK